MLRRIAGQQGVALRHGQAPAFQGHPHVGRARDVGRELARFFGPQFHGAQRVQQLLFQRRLALDLGQRIVERQQGPLDGLALALQHVHLVFLPRVQQRLVGHLELLLLRLGLGFQPRHRGIGRGPVLRPGARFRSRRKGVAGLDGELRASARARDPDQTRAPHQHETSPALEVHGQLLIRNPIRRVQLPVASRHVRQHRLALEFLDLRVQRVLELGDGGRILDQRFLLVQDARPPNAQLDGGPRLVDLGRLGQIEHRGAHGERHRQEDGQPFLARDLQQPQRIQRIQRTGIRRRRFAVVGRRRRRGAVVPGPGGIDRRGHGRRHGGRRRQGSRGRRIHRSVLSELSGCSPPAAAGDAPDERTGSIAGIAASSATHA